MKLLEQCRHTARVRHLSYRTEQANVHCIERYIRFHGIRNPVEMGAPEVEAFLTHLAVDEHVSAGTQNQALAAILFLYREVLRLDLGALDTVRARRPKRMPTYFLARPSARNRRLFMKERFIEPRAGSCTLRAPRSDHRPAV